MELVIKKLDNIEKMLLPQPPPTTETSSNNSDSAEIMQMLESISSRLTTIEKRLDDIENSDIVIDKLCVMQTKILQIDDKVSTIGSMVAASDMNPLI